MGQAVSRRSRFSVLPAGCRKWLALPALLLAAGCSGSAIPLSGGSLGALQPGVTTLAQISESLGADPVAVYREAEGPFMARWASGASLVTDALYWRQELWIAFDADGRYRRVVNTVNISRPGEVQEAAAVSSSGASLAPGPGQAPHAPGGDMSLGGPLGSLGSQPVDSPVAVFPVDAGARQAGDAAR